MQGASKINEINFLLSEGAKTKIAEMTGLSYRTVINFFQNKPVRINTREKILKAVQKIVKEDNALLEI